MHKHMYTHMVWQYHFLLPQKKVVIIKMSPCATLILLLSSSMCVRCMIDLLACKSLTFTPEQIRVI